MRGGGDRSRPQEGARTLAPALRHWLERAPPGALPVTYRGLAQAFSLSPPGTIARVTQALEQLMVEDAAAGRPFIAAFVVSQSGTGMPGAGFFEHAVALSRFPAASELQKAAWEAEFARARAFYGQ